MNKDNTGPDQMGVMRPFVPGCFATSGMWMLAPVSPIPAADLRSAGGAVCPRRCQHPDFAAPGHHGHAAPHRLGNADGRPYGTRRRLAGAIGVLGSGIDVCHPKDNKNIMRRSSNVSHDQRVADYSAAGHGVWERSARSAGPRDTGCKLCAEAAPQAGSQAIDERGNVIEELPTPVPAAQLQLEAGESEPRDLLVADSLSPTGKKVYEPLSGEESRPMDGLVEMVESSGLNSSEVLATLFTLEIKGIVRRPGKPFNKVLL